MLLDALILKQLAHIPIMLYKTELILLCLSLLAMQSTWASKGVKTQKAGMGDLFGLFFFVVVCAGYSIVIIWHAGGLSDMLGGLGGGGKGGGFKMKLHGNYCGVGHGDATYLLVPFFALTLKATDMCSQPLMPLTR